MKKVFWVNGYPVQKILLQRGFKGIGAKLDEYGRICVAFEPTEQFFKVLNEINRKKRDEENAKQR